MGGGGHHHAHHPPIPDPSIYKVAEIPELMAVQRALKAKGLHDPWLRNEVWRYKTPSKGAKFRAFFFRGFWWGLGAAIITTAVGFMEVPHHHHHKEEHGGAGHH